MFFIIWGWGRQTRRSYGNTFPVHCSNCKNSVWWQLTWVRTWFTLFFIPVIPYRSEHWLICPVCSWGIQVAGQQKAAAERLNAVSLRFAQDSSVEPEWQAALQEFVNTRS